MMWWAVWCVAVVGAGAMAAAAPSDGLVPISSADWDQIDASTTDDENMGNAVAPLGGRYAAAAPWLYLLADMPKDSQVVSGRMKRRMPSLSIDLPMSVLRHKLSQEQERKAQALRAVANRNFLNGIGKRAFQWTPEEVARFY
ncbi:diuretic hormone 41 isoform X2 [Papilio machaon]|nr:diuretic hormone 41 isoform X2 [Papilio machaon]